MNYGYFSDNLSLNLKGDDELERYPIQLYHHVCSQIDLNGLNVLEVGSGRGGGASFIARYHNPKTVTGIDISQNAINLCQNTYNINNLKFLIGDSENIPFDDNYFDAVVNVESSHCYPSLDKFINEVNRVLKPGGSFLYCDLVITSELEDHLNQLKNDDLELVNYKDITDNIIKASDLMTDDRNNIIKDVKSNFLKKILRSFAAVKGSKIYESFVNRHYKYISLSMKKR
ncbi:MAG: class I SAM-dependent methyltransferase [Flavobacteriales bacterium]|nr:class I SAM-dependent methyltransferase [Flavobacteriales bacterium]